jgi:hypothetical protein
MSESLPSLPAETQPRQTKPIGKFDKLFPGSRKPAVLKELTPKHRLLIQYQVWGVEYDFVRKIGKEPFEPLTLTEAAKILEIRLKNARSLQSDPLYQKEYARQMKSWRDGRKCDAWRKVDEILRDDGDGSAAVRKVQLAAANMLIGEQAEARAGASINITNQTLNLTAGVVIRLPNDAPSPPLELQPREDDAQFIEGQAIQHHEPEEGFAIDPDAEAAMARAWPNTVSGDAD